MTVTFTVLTSLLLVFVCEVLAILLGRHRKRIQEDRLAARLMGDPNVATGDDGRELAPWIGFFTALALANLFGAAGQALGGGVPVGPNGPAYQGAVAAYGTAVGLVTVLASLAAVVAVSSAQTAAARRYAPASRMASWRAVIGLQLLMASLAVIILPFSGLPVLAHAVVGLGSVLVAELLALGRGEGRGWLIGGLLVAALAGAAFLVGRGLPMGLEGSSAAHLILLAGCWMVFAGVRGPPARPASPALGEAG